MAYQIHVQNGYICRIETDGGRESEAEEGTKTIFQGSKTKTQTVRKEMLGIQSKIPRAPMRNYREQLKQDEPRSKKMAQWSQLPRQGLPYGCSGRMVSHRVYPSCLTHTIILLDLFFFL